MCFLYVKKKQGTSLEEGCLTFKTVSWKYHKRRVRKEGGVLMLFKNTQLAENTTNKNSDELDLKLIICYTKPSKYC